MCTRRRTLSRLSIAAVAVLLSTAGGLGQSPMSNEIVRDSWTQSANRSRK